MGTIHKFKKKNGQVAWYVLYVDAQGVRRHRVAKHARTREQADQYLRECESQTFNRQRNLDEIKTALPSVIEHYREYLKKQLKNKEISPRTCQRYGPEIKLFESYIEESGLNFVNEFDAKAWENFQEWLRSNGNAKSGGGFGPKTINHICSTITAAINLAVKNDLCIAPPARVHRLDLKERKPRFLSKDEIKSFLNASPPEYIPLWKWYLYTGMRREEIIMQEVADVRLDMNVILVSVSKTARGRKRSIPISAELKKVIDKQKLSGKYVFPFLHKFSINWTLREIAAICKKAKIKEAFTPHVFRHTFAVWALAGGIPLLEVSAMLGHTDIKTTMVYAHIAPESQQVNIQKLKY